MVFFHLTEVLTVVLLGLGYSREEEDISICEEPYAGCVGFYNKADNFSSFKQCLKACNFEEVPGAKSLQGYSCVSYSQPCTPIKFYEIPSFRNPFLSWIECLEMCHLLTNGDGTIPAWTGVCVQAMSECYGFENSKGNLDDFMKCYVDCQVPIKENHTQINSMYICNPQSRSCANTEYFSLPEELHPEEKLKDCYEKCAKAGGSSIPTTSTPTAGLFRCDQLPNQKLAVTNATKIPSPVYPALTRMANVRTYPLARRPAAKKVRQAYISA
ncbi:hypothetical protein SprV_0802553900 [Sparganum proliferum]